MSLPYNHDLIPRAKELRKNSTREENRLWYGFLRSYPIRFQRQKALGDFIADFYCHAAKLVIEIDGSQHYTEQGVAHDRERTAVFQQYGVEVLRFSNWEVNNQFNGVCRAIHEEMKTRLKGRDNL